MKTIRHYALLFCSSLLLLVAAAPVHAGCKADPWDSGASTVNGVPIGMTQDVVDYFKRAEYVQTVMPNGAGTSAGMLG